MVARRKCGFRRYVTGGICAAFVLSALPAFGAEPAAPAVAPEAPAAKTEAPAAKTEAPAAKTEAPAAKTETPAAKTEAPAAKADEKSAADPSRPPTKVAAPETPAAPQAQRASDHDLMVGRIGVSWFGLSTIPIATGSPGGTADDPAVAAGPPASVSTPAIGVRYWLTERMGLDIGAGFSISSGSVRTVTSGADKQTVFSLLFHGGVPLSITSGKHISLQLIPEMNLGFATSSVEPPVEVNPPPNATLSGVRFDLGARIGGEVHFGFMDIPELALEGSVGAFMTYQATRVSVGEAFASDHNLLFSTASYQNPWDIFTSYVRARYYF